MSDFESVGTRTEVVCRSNLLWLVDLGWAQKSSRISLFPMFASSEGQTRSSPNFLANQLLVSKRHHFLKYQLLEPPRFSFPHNPIYVLLRKTTAVVQAVMQIFVKTRTLFPSLLSNTTIFGISEGAHELPLQYPKFQDSNLTPFQSLERP